MEEVLIHLSLMPCYTDLLEIRVININGTCSREWYLLFSFSFHDITENINLGFITSPVYLHDMMMMIMKTKKATKSICFSPCIFTYKISLIFNHNYIDFITIPFFHLLYARFFLYVCFNISTFM